GEGWELTLEALHFPKLDRTIPLGDLARVSFHVGALCLWTQGEVEPSIAVPGTDPQAQALARVLQDHVREDPARPVPHPLGQALFNYASLPYFGPWLTVLGRVFLPTSLGVIAFAFYPLPLLLLSLLFLIPFAVLATAVALLRVWVSRRPRLIVHERGVALAGRHGEQPVPFEQFGAMTWKRGKKFVLTPLAGLNLLEV